MEETQDEPETKEEEEVPPPNDGMGDLLVLESF